MSYNKWKLVGTSRNKGNYIAILVLRFFRILITIMVRTNIKTR